jgi:hypothetical protein
MMNYEPPAQQPGAEALSDIGAVYLRWVRGEIYSDEAIAAIADLVGHDHGEWFEGCLESMGWVRDDDDEGTDRAV